LTAEQHEEPEVDVYDDFIERAKSAGAFMFRLLDHSAGYHFDFAMRDDDPFIRWSRSAPPDPKGWHGSVPVFAWELRAWVRQRAAASPVASLVPGERLLVLEAYGASAQLGARVWLYGSFQEESVDDQGSRVPADKREYAMGRVAAGVWSLIHHQGGAYRYDALRLDPKDAMTGRWRVYLHCGIGQETRDVGEVTADTLPEAIVEVDRRWPSAFPVPDGR
jgi:hypothetical protein